MKVKPVFHWGLNLIWVKPSENHILLSKGIITTRYCANKTITDHH